MNSPALQLNNVSRHFVQGGTTLDVLRGVNLTINAGEMVALVGPSGSGKTTLLQIAGLLDKPDSGEVVIDGVTCGTAGDNVRTATRLGKMGFVYQFHHLLPEFSAQENIVLPQLIAGKSKAVAKERAALLLNEMGLSARTSHRPAKLSGGEQQRVAIARALANNPVLLLADEPTGNLDHHTAEEVFAVLLKIVKEKKLAALIATHNMELARRMDKIVTLQDGVLK